MTRPKRLKALLLGYYGQQNLGDDLMLHCLRQWLEPQGVSLTVVSENPAAAAEEYGLAAVENVPLLFEWSWRNTWVRGAGIRFVRQMRRHDALLVGGGDLIRSDLGWRTFFFTVEKIILAHLLRKDVYLLNVGIGIPAELYARAILGWSLRRCKAIVVRDRRSYDVSIGLGAKSQLWFTPDIVTEREKLPYYPPVSGAPSIVVSLRSTTDTFGQFFWTAERLQNLASALADVSAAHQAPVVLSEFHPDHDKRIADEMERLLGSGNATTIRRVRGMEALAEFGNALLVVAMRLHAGVLSAAYKKRCVLLPYDEKVKQFGQQMGIRFSVPDHLLDSSHAVKEVMEGCLTSPCPAYAPAAPHEWHELSLESIASG